MAQADECVGIDVSKQRLDVVVWPTGETFQVANDRQGRAELVRKLKRRSAQAVALEASGGYERPVIKALLEADLPVRRVNPFRVRQFALACGVMAKNDHLDAMIIARFVATVPQPALERRPAVDKLAELVTTRRQLSDELTRAVNQAEQAQQPVVKRLAKRRVDRLKADILLIDKTLAKAVQDDPDLARKNEILRSVPCIGPVVAHSLLGLMPELGNLSNRKIAALLGVAPFDCDSGAFKGERHIFGGRKPVRDVLYMAALVGGSYNPALKAYRQRLIQAGKKPKVALVAMMRKLITIVNAMIRDDKTWSYT